MGDEDSESFFLSFLSLLVEARVFPDGFWANDWSWGPPGPAPRLHTGSHGSRSVRGSRSKYHKTVQETVPTKAKDMAGSVGLTFQKNNARKTSAGSQYIVWYRAVVGEAGVSPVSADLWWRLELFG